MKINLKKYFWAVPLVIAAVFLLNIFIQQACDKMGLNKKRNSVALSYKKPDKMPEQTDITAEESLNENERAYLSFELRGTIVGTPCLAVIYNSRTSSQNVYKINDSIEDYKIINIASAKIKIERKGITKVLLLAGKNHEQENSNTVVSYTKTDGTMTISRAEIRKKIMPAVNDLLSKIKILPMQTPDSNKLKGFRIDNVPAGSIVESVGIKNGDIIHSIEGQQLTSMRQAWLIFDRIKTQPRFEVVVLRGDKPVTLRYKMSE